MDKKEPMHRKYGTKNYILYKAGNTDPFVTPGLAHGVCEQEMLTLS